jgi:hypothetical protein
LRIPLIVISQMSRSRSAVTVIKTSLLTMPEKRRRMALFGSLSLPLTVELVSLFLGVRQAFGDRNRNRDRDRDRDRVAPAETFAFKLDAMCAVNGAVQDRVAQGGITDDVVPATNRDLAGYSGAILLGLGRR